MVQRKRSDRPTPRKTISDLVARHGSVTSAEAVAATGLTRQAVHRHLREMVDARELFAVGSGRGAHYVRKLTSIRLRRPRTGLDEAKLYEELEDRLAELRTLPRNAARIVVYVFTEMVNNAIDHSQGKIVEASVELARDSVMVEITDDGIGAFANVRRALELGAEIEAIGEISKGKTTTDPTHHSGQGLFFSSKAADSFVIESGELRWIVDNRIGDNAIAAIRVRRGTRVRFEVARETKRDLRQIFDEYTTDHEFDRTRTVVRLFAYGTTFVSRSEAKRMLHGLERFREVVLDFTGVDAIGQGFADEVFRVWARAHAGTRLDPIAMVEPVAFMVKRARAPT